MTMRTNALLASALALTLLACGDGDFNKPWRIDKPRILAIQAQPPQPSFGETTVLSTLLYQPPLDRLSAGQCPTPDATTYTWSWCPMPMVANSETNTFECPFPEEAFKQMYGALGVGDPPPYELGQGETLPFTNPFPASLLYALCRGDIGSSLGGTSGDPGALSGQSVFSCDLPAQDVADKVDSEAIKTHPIGFKITIKVVITPTCPDLLPKGYSPLIGLYSLHLPTNDAIPGNQNPAISGIFVTSNWTEGPEAGTAAPLPAEPADGGIAADDGGAAGAEDGGQGSADAGHDGPDGSVTLEEEPAVKVKRDKHVGLKLDIDIGTAEHLAVPATIDYSAARSQQGIPALTRHYEHLDIAWYAEAGDFTGRGQGENTGYLPTQMQDGHDDPPNAQDLANFDFNITNTWDLPKREDYDPNLARIIVVVRDGRGGVAWTSKQVRLEAQP
jgi:hypothetical protein